MKAKVTHSNVDPDVFEMKAGGTVIGTVNRHYSDVPAKREGKSRKVTTFNFTPTAEFTSVPAFVGGTMKEIKSVISAGLPELPTEPKGESLPASDLAAA